MATTYTSPVIEKIERYERMMKQQLFKMKKKAIADLLAQCTPAQIAQFGKMYRSGVGEGFFITAVRQIENTLQMNVEVAEREALREASPKKE